MDENDIQLLIKQTFEAVGKAAPGLVGSDNQVRLVCACIQAFATMDVANSIDELTKKVKLLASINS